MRPEYSLKENLIIDKVQKYALYIDKLIDRQETFSPSKYDKMIKYFDDVLNMSEIHYEIREYTDYCYSVLIRYDYHKQYERYLKLQKIRKLK
jgi:hypothetical protein